MKPLLSLNYDVEKKMEGKRSSVSYALTLRLFLLWLLLVLIAH